MSAHTRSHEPQGHDICVIVSVSNAHTCYLYVRSFTSVCAWARNDVTEFPSMSPACVDVALYVLSLWVAGWWASECRCGRSRHNSTEQQQQLPTGCVRTDALHERKRVLYFDHQHETRFNQ